MIDTVLLLRCVSVSSAVDTIFKVFLWIVAGVFRV